MAEQITHYESAAKRQARLLENQRYLAWEAGYNAAVHDILTTGLQTPITKNPYTYTSDPSIQPTQH